MNADTEGDARTSTHALACPVHGQCMSCCRCWCHGITKHLNGSLRRDVKADR